MTTTGDVIVPEADAVTGRRDRSNNESPNVEYFVDVETGNLHPIATAKRVEAEAHPELPLQITETQVVVVGWLEKSKVKNDTLLTGRINDYCLLAWISALLFCLPIGVFAILASRNVNLYQQHGDYMVRIIIKEVSIHVYEGCSVVVKEDANAMPRDHLDGYASAFPI